MKTQKFLNELKTHIIKQFGSQKDAAEAWNVTPAYVSAVLTGKTKAPDWMITDAGFKRIIVEEEFISLGEM